MRQHDSSRYLRNAATNNDKLCQRHRACARLPGLPYANQRRCLYLHRNASRLHQSNFTASINTLRQDESGWSELFSTSLRLALLDGCDGVFELEPVAQTFETIATLPFPATDCGVHRGQKWQ